ncbi:MAG TPA: hypothetical protein VH085_09665 [Nocardioides sp.]|nr:hypothetical protein [Nocardioides sp.]
MSRKLPVALLGAVPALALALVPSAALADHGGGDGGHHHGHHGDHHGDNLLRSDLVPSKPTDAAINGVNPGSLPWTIRRGEVRVRANGRIDVRIRGLQVLRNGGADNPIASIDAVVYAHGVKVADSGPEPMSVPDGDARFATFVSLPRHLHDVTVLISPSTAVGAAYIASGTDD